MENQNPAAESLVSRASKAAFWALSSNITASAISFVATVILARMLAPKDFGLFGMAVLVTGIVRLFGNLGLGGALIQKKELTEEELSTVFWVNLISGTGLTFICIVVSPLAAWFFRESAVQSILLLLSCTFFVSSLSSVHATLVQKELRMKQMAVIEVSSRLLGVLTKLTAAFYGLGFWSFAIGMIVDRFVKTGGFLLVLPWRPSLVFSKARFHEFFRFGRNLFGNSLLNYIQGNAGSLVIGRALGVEWLGFFQMAYNLPYLILDYVSSSVGAVSFPVFSKLQDDNERLAKGYLRIVRCIALATFPALAGLAFCAEDFVLFIYGPRWLPAAAPLQILCVGAALASINSLVAPLMNAKGRPDLSFKYSCVRLPLTLITIVCGASLHGILGVAWGMLLIELLSVLLIVIAFRLIEQPVGNFFRSLLPSTIACLLMIAVLVLLNQLFLMHWETQLLRILFNSVVGACIYAAIVFTFFKADWMEAASLVGQVLDRRK